MSVIWSKTRLQRKNIRIVSKYLTAADYNKLTSQPLDAKMKQKQLVNKSAIAGFINKS